MNADSPFKKKWRAFHSRPLARYSLYLLLFLLLVSLTAEFWANNKPLVLFFKGEIFFPILKDSHPSRFGQKDQLIMDYKNLSLEKSDFAVFPLIPWSPYESNRELALYPAPPSKDNFLGTDDRGRDVLSRLIYGYRYSMLFAVSVWLFSYLIGSVLGAVMGYFGGKTDLFGQRITEVLDSLPSLIILITLTTVIGKNFWILVVFFSLMSWVGISLYMRAEFLRLRKRAFVESARAQGLSHWGLIFKHIAPNSLNPILTFSPFALAGFISILAVLDYLGFGLPPPTPSWGELLSQAERHITTAWWLAVFPSLALFSTLLALSFIGNGLRDAFDPRESH